MKVTDTALSEMFATVLPLLDERQRRAMAGAQARALGGGGIVAVSRSARMSRTKVQKAVAEVDAGLWLGTAVRRAGAGRKKLVVKDPGLLERLDALVEPG